MGILFIQKHFPEHSIKIQTRIFLHNPLITLMSARLFENYSRRSRMTLRLQHIPQIEARKQESNGQQHGNAEANSHYPAPQ